MTPDPHAEQVPRYPRSPQGLARIALHLITHYPEDFALPALQEIWQVCQLEQLPSYYRPDPRHWPDCLPSFLLEEQVAVPGSYLATYRRLAFPPRDGGDAAWPGWFPAVLFLDIERTRQLASLAVTTNTNRAPLLWMDHSTTPATSHFVAAAPPPPQTSATDQDVAPTEPSVADIPSPTTRQWTEQVTATYEQLRANDWNEYAVAASPRCPFSPVQIRFLAEQLGWPLHTSTATTEPPTPTRKRRRLTAMRDDMESRSYRALKRLDDDDDPNSLGARVNLAQFLFDRMLRLDDKIDALADSDVVVYRIEDVKRDLEEFGEPRAAIPGPSTGHDAGAATAQPEGGGAALAQAEPVRLPGSDADAAPAPQSPGETGPGDTAGGTPP